MVYVNMKDCNGVETYKEAKAMLKEYRISDI